LLYALILLVVAVPWVRQARLNRIPDLGEPFDVRAFQDGGSDDAFPLYREAFSRYVAPSRAAKPDRSLPLFYDVMDVRLNSGWASPEVKAWIGANLEALALWRRATERSGLGYVPFDRRGFGAEWYDAGDGTDTKTGKHSSLRVDDPERGMLRWLASREAVRLEQDGDLAGAWNWHRAVLRYSRHVGMRSLFADRLQAVELHRLACEQGESWASDPQVDAGMLRRALDDALALSAMTPPLSDAIKADYLEAANLLEHPPGQLLNRVVDDFKGSAPAPFPGTPFYRQRAPGYWGQSGIETEGDPYVQYLPGILAQATYYFDGEPERSRRLLRQVYTNWLAHCNKPLAQRPPTMTDLNLFLAPPSSPGMLPAEDIVRELASPGLARHVLPRWVELQTALDRERSRQARLVVNLAGELYQRERGNRPASPRLLVGLYLTELPEGFVDEAPTQSPAPSTSR
jgi:hypothetical protein